MTLPDRTTAKTWVGRDVLDRDSESIGTCVRVLADDATGAAEWAAVGLSDATFRLVPLLDVAVGAGGDGDVRVAFTRSTVLAAPALGSTEQVTGEEERALYAHYGVPASGDSSTVLPAGEDGSTTPPPAASPVVGPAPRTGSSAVQRHGAPDDRVRQAAAAALAVALVGAAVVVATRGRRRRVPPTASERAAATARLQAERAAPALAAAGRSALSAATTTAALGVMGVQRGVPAGRRVATVIGSGGQGLAATVSSSAREAAGTLAAGGRALGERTATLGARGGARASGLGHSAAVDVGTAGHLAAAGVRSTGRALRSAGGTALDGAAAAGQTGGKAVRRAALVAGLGIGYVAGARAGRERYDRLRERAQPLLQRPEVQQAGERITSGWAELRRAVSGQGVRADG